MAPPRGTTKTKQLRPSAWHDQQFAFLRGQGRTMEEIAAETGFTRKTVSAHLKRLQQPPSGPKVETRGRKPKLDERHHRMLKHLVDRHQVETISQAHRTVIREAMVKVCRRTVAKSLQASGFHSYRKRNRPFLQLRHRRARYAWALKHIKWTVAQWLKVIFSDETKINCISSDGRRHVLCPKGAPLDGRRVNGVIKFGGGSIMLWGSMTAEGLGDVALVEGNMNGESYTQILAKHMLPAAKRTYKRRKFIFQQDNDPKHTSKVAKAFFAKRKVEVLDWPANSPDLNPIEHAWGLLKKRVREQGPAANTDELWQHTQTAWAELQEKDGADYCRKLVESMPRRVQAVIDARGGYTSY